MAHTVSMDNLLSQNIIATNSERQLAGPASLRNPAGSSLPWTRGPSASRPSPWLPRRSRCNFPHNPSSSHARGFHTAARYAAPHPLTLCFPVTEANTFKYVASPKHLKGLDPGKHCGNGRTAKCHRKRVFQTRASCCKTGDDGRGIRRKYKESTLQFNSNLPCTGTITLAFPTNNRQ